MRGYPQKRNLYIKALYEAGGAIPDLFIFCTPCINMALHGRIVHPRLNNFKNMADENDFPFVLRLATVSFFNKTSVIHTYCVVKVTIANRLSSAL